MTDIQYPNLSAEKAYSAINLECPFCRDRETVDWDRRYNPRYHVCPSCDGKYIYEPMASAVRCSAPDEVECQGDPDCREWETISGQEE